MLCACTVASSEWHTSKLTSAHVLQQFWVQKKKQLYTFLLLVCSMKKKITAFFLSLSLSILTFYARQKDAPKKQNSMNKIEKDKLTISHTIPIYAMHEVNVDRMWILSFIKINVERKNWFEMRKKENRRWNEIYTASNVMHKTCLDISDAYYDFMIWR